MDSETNLHLYGAIEKYDSVDGHLIVSGIASTEDVDAQGETVSAEAMRKAIPSYLLSGTVREMHQPIAAGKPISAFVDDEGRTHLTAKIVDKDTIDKIKAGVLKGFSIGGKALSKVGKTITSLLLKDVSVVDVPCNSQCLFNIIKFDKPGDKCTDKGCKNHHEAAVEKCGDCKMTKSMSDDYMKKVDSIADSVAALTKVVDLMAKNASTPPVLLVDGKPVDIAKVVSDLGDLQKNSQKTQEQIQANERASIISKMDSQGRVPFKPDGIAYTLKELGEVSLDILKVLSANSPVIPTQARSVYKGEQDPKLIDPNLKGSELIVKAWEKDYSSLSQMTARLNN